MLHDGARTFREFMTREPLPSDCLPQKSSRSRRQEIINARTASSEQTGCGRSNTVVAARR
jgi:hypothetical protein